MGSRPAADIGINSGQLIVLLCFVVAATWVVYRGGWKLHPILSIVLWFLLFFIAPFALQLNGVFDTLSTSLVQKVRLYLMLVLPGYMLITRLVFGPAKLWRSYWVKQGFDLRMTVGDAEAHNEVQAFPGADNMLRPDFRGSLTVNMAKTGIATKTIEDGKIQVVFLYLLATRAIACGLVLAWFDPESEGDGDSDMERASFSLERKNFLNSLPDLLSGRRLKREDYAARLLADNNWKNAKEMEALLARPKVAELLSKLSGYSSMSLQCYGRGRPDGLRCLLSIRAPSHSPQHTTHYDLKKVNMALELFELVREREMGWAPAGAMGQPISSAADFVEGDGGD